MLETPEEIELVVKHPVERWKKRENLIDKLAANRIAVVRAWQTFVTLPLVTVKKSSVEEPCQPCQWSLFPLAVGTEESSFAMCRFLQTSLNEINKLRLNWQLASEVIILSLMSPQWNGRRFGLNRNSAGCGEAVFSSTKKWRVMAARVYLSRFLNTHTRTCSILMC